MFFDPMYLLFMLPGLLITMWASFRVNSTFKKYNNVRVQSGLTGAMAARQILDANGLNDVPVERVSGNLTDHYDPKTRVIRLSDATYAAPSVGAVGVAAHECGHAVQHATGYTPLKIRNGIVPVCNIGSMLSVPLIFIGIFLNILNLAYVGIGLFSLAVLFQLITLPVELNASRRALATLNGSTTMMTPEEADGARRVLSAAALTYVAALLQSLLQLLYWVSVIGRRRR